MWRMTWRTFLSGPSSGFSHSTLLPASSSTNTCAGKQGLDNHCARVVVNAHPVKRLGAR